TTWAGHRSRTFSIRTPKRSNCAGCSGERLRPKFLTCGASCCPLDPVWRTAVHLPGEKVCAYLLATGKEGATERHVDAPVFQEALVRLLKVRANHPEIGGLVEKAS